MIYYLVAVGDAMVVGAVVAVRPTNAAVLFLFP